MQGRKTQRGATVNELMVGLSLIAILMGLSAPSFSEFINKRKVAGTANVVASFFDDLKVESIKRNQFLTVSFVKDEDSPAWCLGAVVGRNQACNCLATTPECLIDSQPMVLLADAGTVHHNVEAVFNNGFVSFDPTRGILTDTNGGAAIQVRHATRDLLVNVTVNASGRVSKCSPANHPRLDGYPQCI